MRYRDAARKLAELGCYEIPRRSGGSHRRWFNPEAQKDAGLGRARPENRNSALRNQAVGPGLERVSGTMSQPPCALSTATALLYADAGVTEVVYVLIYKRLPAFVLESPDDDHVV